MPIYEYLCHACGERTEVMQKVSDPAETVCPNCGKSALTKVVSAAGFHLKGTGWYATDFKDKKPEVKSNTQAETKSESKKPSEDKT
jgi:putative FmdB family regulatory protein